MVAAAGLLALAGAAPATAAVVNVCSTLETVPVHNPLTGTIGSSNISYDAVDDAAIWVHPTNPSLSLIINADKSEDGGYNLYNLDGSEHDWQADGRLNISRAPKWDENLTSADAIPVAPAAESATLLMPLPDTRDEILAIGAALAATPPRDTFFGDQASRRNVLAADLRHRRVIAFATHGLVAGDLPGLDQPCLLYTSPSPRD